MHDNSSYHTNILKIKPAFLRKARGFVHPISDCSLTFAINKPSCKALNPILVFYVIIFIDEHSYIWSRDEDIVAENPGFMFSMH